MKILSAQQTQQLDEFTIEQKPIDSLDLMEHASRVFVNWFTQQFQEEDTNVHIFCGPGNNGGDGLAIGRLLHHASYEVHLYLCKIGSQTSADYDQNLKRLPRHGAIGCQDINKEDSMPTIPKGTIIIDGVFGSGLNRPVEGYWAKLLEHLNTQDVTRVAIDIPSGMFADQHTAGVSFKANYTFSFELPKLGFFFPENYIRVGQWDTASIGLLPQGIQNLKTNNFYIDQTLAKSLYRPREKYSHKGTYGHALIMAGSYGMFGAALLTAKAALRAGAGLVSLRTAKAAYNIVQTAIPEVMADVDAHEHYITSMPDLSSYSTVGAGPGIGKHESTRKVIYDLIKEKNKPIVLDADALNILSAHSTLLPELPENTIITPHPKEFERLFGPTDNNFQRLKLQRKKAEELKIIIVLKGAHTCIATPDGNCHFNSTGNPGMATGGSGDVLTGIITGLLAQSYSAAAAAILGVYLHGLAGDIAVKEGGSEESVIAGDLIEYLGFAFQELKNKA